MNGSSPGSAAISLIILTGFLGAGKTTLLKRILTGDHGLRAAVLINDFGSINIDADLIVSVDRNIVSLSNGCVCCSIGGELTAAVEDLLALPEPPEYIILEASGIADPAEIAITFSTQTNVWGVAVDSVVCVLDAEQFFGAPEHMDLKLRQVAPADLVLLNKVDLVDEKQIEKVDAWLKENFFRHRVIRTVQCDVPLVLLLSSGSFDPLHADAQFNSSNHHAGCNHGECSLEQHHHHHHHHHEHDVTAFQSWSYETRSALSLGALEQFVRKLPLGVYRCKGVLFTDENPDRRTILQVVGRRVSFTDGGGWEQETPASKIVVIASAGQLDLDNLREQFDQCLACLYHDDV